MELDEECKGCLYGSQMHKVESTQTDAEKLAEFKKQVKLLCENPPAHYCAPILMRDINGIHRKIFGADIDYTREKSLFNRALSALEERLFSEIMQSSDPVAAALKFAMAANYIDFARMSDLNEGAVEYVISAARRAVPNAETLESFKEKLKKANSLCVLHDNCGEIVLDKILIRVIKRLYPEIKVTSVVRGRPIINDVTAADAEEVGLYGYAEVVDNGTDVAGTYLKEVRPEVKRLLETSDVILSKGLGNLETLYGEGYKIFYAFTCKCKHVSRRFNAPLFSAVFAEEL
ncbi:MAG: ARMT1-like domain-containing protein [Clostridia bacterium]|nr:ARMT1-like domain-containing protein [Clostridia bacterium]